MSRTATDFFIHSIFELIASGLTVSPRGCKCLERLGVLATISMDDPTVYVSTRKLCPAFAVGEAWWIASGNDKLVDIALFSSKIERYSDDGISFFGAYGPRFAAQFDYIIESLLKPHSRQATMTFWRPNPPETKDMPCTISATWMIRNGQLHVFDNMRSSDIWTGFPYDIYTFTILSRIICAVLATHGLVVTPGNFYFFAASQHLYFSDIDKAREVIRNCCSIGGTKQSVQTLDSSLTVADAADSSPFAIDANGVKQSDWRNLNTSLTEAISQCQNVKQCVTVLRNEANNQLELRSARRQQQKENRSSEAIS